MCWELPADLQLPQGLGSNLTHFTHILSRLLVLGPVQRPQLFQSLLVTLCAVDVPNGSTKAEHQA